MLPGVPGAQVRETWQSYELELVPYQNKCRLIRGWDELFSKCSEHLNSLSAMKLSPYYKVFEDEAAAWEEKLNRVTLLFDVWIDVQRQWVYLESIFSGSADIKNLLPTETSRFQVINAEFLGLTKKVAKTPAVMEVVAIPGVQRSLERLADLLGKIQKALGEYLERERAAFPRFYFVGDEDLLDIIGNSKDVLKIQKHFKKMFAGLSSLLLQMEDGPDGVAVPAAIVGMASREGEEVPFAQPISLKEGLKINEWLGALEKRMRLTLAALLGDALRDQADFFPADPAAAAAPIAAEPYLKWVAQYPAQLVVLASQVLWSEATERALQKGDAAAVGAALQAVLARLQGTLTVLADTVLHELPPIQRRKCEHLITELVHQRDVVRSLVRAQVASPRAFEWLYHMRFYYNPKGEDPLTRLAIRMANASFEYGFEYLGITDKLVQTPLTDRCYLTLTQALELRLGGSPFGPAGTGKTESVKVRSGHARSRAARQLAAGAHGEERGGCQFVGWTPPSVYRRWARSWAALCWCSAATRPLTSKPWAASLWACAKWAPGAAYVFRRTCTHKWAAPRAATLITLQPALAHATGGVWGGPH